MSLRSSSRSAHHSVSMDAPQLGQLIRDRFWWQGTTLMVSYQSTSISTSRPDGDRGDERSSEEVRSRLVKVERALELIVLDQRQATVDSKVSEAVAVLAASLSEVTCVRRRPSVSPQRPNRYESRLPECPLWRG